MKKTLLAAVFVGVMSACGSDDPESQLKRIDELLAENQSLTAEQTSQVTDSVANGKRLLAEGKNKEASAQFAAAIEALEKAADADRFNKSE